MLRRNLPDAALAVLLLSIYAPWANAAEPNRPGTSRVRQASAEEAQPVKSDLQAAEQRWQELKSRHGGGSAPLWRPVSQSENRRAAPPIRPIPTDEPNSSTGDAAAVQSVEEAAATVRPRDADEPLPRSEFEQSPGRLAEQSSNADERELAEDDFFLTQQSDSEPQDDLPLPDAKAPEEPKSLESEEPADPGYATQQGERRLRRMSEISPHYDVTIDEDIREFAREQARQYNVEFQKGDFPQRNFPGFVYQWEPSNMYHYPLYFEDVPLERYGHTYHPVIQPVVSIAKFSTQLAFLPYQMTLDPICTPKYALGYFRPGECAPKLHYQPPLNAAAAAVEAGVVTGLFFAIP